jgi:hypothetical protein
VGDLMGSHYKKRDNGHDRTKTHKECHGSGEQTQRLLTDP